MADDLGSVLDIIESELREPAESTAIKYYIRDFLWDVRGKRFLFSEASDSFATVASQIEYEMGQDDVPGNILKVDWLRSLTGSTYNVIRQVEIHEIRAQQGSTTATSNYPSIWAWYDQKIVLWPTPSTATTIKIDYQIDSTRDELTGEEFTEDSDTAFTNEFFKQGRSLLTSYVLMRWGLGRGRDPDLSAAQGAVYNKAMSHLLQEVGKAKWGLGQSAPNW